MKQFSQYKVNGFTLLEMILVAAIIGGMLFSVSIFLQGRTQTIRIEKNVKDMKYILSAAMMYYANNPISGTTGGWPPAAVGSSAAANALNCLKGVNSSDVTGCATPAIPYLSRSISKNPWNQFYRAGVGSADTYTTSPSYFVWTAIQGRAGLTKVIADAIALRIPPAYTSTQAPTTSPTGAPVPPTDSSPCDNSTTTCYVVAYVTMPSVEIPIGSDDSGIINFVGLYRHGGCVPVPTCPNSYDEPQIFVAPVSVSGVNDGPTIHYNLNSFTAYAKDKQIVTTTAGPVNCDGTPYNPAPPTACNPQGGTLGVTKYWRVCLQIVTDKGLVSGNQYGQYVTLMAMTRCSPAAGEVSGGGTPFTIFGN